MPKDVEALLLTLLRTRELRERMGPLIHALLLAQLLAAAGHAGPPHPRHRPPRSGPPLRSRLVRRGSVSGRRPRG